MRTLLVALLMGSSCVITLVKAQGFNRRYDAFGSGYQQGAWGIEPTPDGYAVFAVGIEPDTITPDSIIATHRILITFIDSSGSVLWERKHSVPEKSMYLGWADCCDTVDGGFVSAGTIGGADMIGSVRLMRYDANGDTLWTRDFGGPGETWVGSQVKQTSDGGFLVCGYTDAFSFSDAFVLKLDAIGNEHWREHYGESGNVAEDFSCIQKMQTGFLLAGNRYPELDNRDFYIMRIDGTGNEVWSVSFGSPYNEPSPGILYHSNGGLYLAAAWKEDDDHERPYLAMLDTSDGGVVWERNYGPAIYSTTFFAAKECPNTDIIAAGVSYQGAIEQGLLLRASANGDSLWMRTYTYHDDVIETGEGRFWDVLPTDDGGFIATGFANGPFIEGYSQDAWVVKVDSMGCIIPGCDGVGVQELVTNLQGALTLLPNPAHGIVQVQVALPPSLRNKPDLKLTLINAAGQVALVRPAHEGDNTLPLGALGSGLYYLHLSSNSTWLSGAKLVVE